MLKEFTSLIESEKEKVKAVLKPHLHEKIFKRILGGFFDETQKRFIAFAFISIKKNMFYEYDYLFDLSNGGHSAVYFLPATKERTKIYVNQSTFQYKSIRELIEEGIYKSLLVTFIGEYDFEEWNILRDCCFSDKRDSNALLESKIARIDTSLRNHFFHSTTFQETSEHYMNLMKYVRARDENDTIIFPVELKPFIGHSYLVCLVRTERKAKLNLSFQEYVKTAIYQPLVIYLKTKFPDQYQSVSGFYGDDCNFLIPSHRQYCLMIFAAKNDKKKTLLQFYLYHLLENKLYNWTYFKLFPYKVKSSHQLIIEIFSPISQLDSMNYLLDPKCNFDDVSFWNNFVFRRTDGNYQYLTEAGFSLWRVML